MQELTATVARLGCAIIDTVNAFSKWWKEICKSLEIPIAVYAKPNSRIKHLALYAKKKRVRKKNLKRLLKE